MIAYFSADDYWSPRMIERAIFGPRLDDDDFLLSQGIEAFELDIDSQFGYEYERYHSGFTDEELDALDDLDY